MGKRIGTQRRGKGGPAFRSPSHRHSSGRLSLPMIGGKVVRMFHSAGRTSPVALLDSGELIIAPKDLSTESTVKVYDKPEIIENFNLGDVHLLQNVKEGLEICNIEMVPNDGGKVARANGTFAKVIKATEEYAIIKTRSGDLQKLSGNCRTMIGRIAGGGQNDYKID